MEILKVAGEVTVCIKPSGMVKGIVLFAVEGEVFALTDEEARKVAAALNRAAIASNHI